MDPGQLTQLLLSKGVAQGIVDHFTQNAISGKLVMDGLSDDDLKEMGIALVVQRKAVLAALKTVGGL